jgi:hypothetical protein
LRIDDNGIIAAEVERICCRTSQMRRKTTISSNATTARTSCHIAFQNSFYRKGLHPIRIAADKGRRLVQTLLALDAMWRIMKPGHCRCVFCICLFFVSRDPLRAVSACSLKSVSQPFLNVTRYAADKTRSTRGRAAPSDECAEKLEMKASEGHDDTQRHSPQSIISLLFGCVVSLFVSWSEDLTTSSLHRTFIKRDGFVLEIFGTHGEIEIFSGRSLHWLVFVCVWIPTRLFLVGTSQQNLCHTLLYFR